MVLVVVVVVVVVVVGGGGGGDITYSAVKIMTQAVSRQKKEILYLSPQANTCKYENIFYKYCFTF